MDRLPEELLALICEHCEHAAQKRLRLISKRLHEASTPNVFEHFYLGLFEYGLFRLRDLATSPLGKHVKKLTLFSDILPSWSRTSYENAIDLRPDFSTWLRARKSQIREGQEGSGMTSHLHAGNPHQEYESLGRHCLTQQEVEAGWNAYSRCVDEQARWSQEKHSVAFRESFSLLPHLSEAVVQCATPFSGRTNDWPVWKALRTRIAVGPDDFAWREDFDEPDFAHMSGQAALCLLEAVGYRASVPGKQRIGRLSVHSSHIDPYLNLMDDADSRNLAQWIADGEDGANGFYQTLDKRICHPRHQPIFDGFRHLTALCLHVPHATVSAHVSGGGMAIETMHILGHYGKNLQRLDLRYGDDEMSPGGDLGAPLEFLFDTDEALFPELQFLALSTNVDGALLLDFLGLHAGTLKSLELRDMLVYDVHSFIEQFPKVVDLDHVYMECLWDETRPSEGEPDVKNRRFLTRGTDYDDAYEISVKAYLLGQSEKLPPIEEKDGILGGTIVEWSEWAREYRETVARGDLSDDESL